MRVFFYRSRMFPVLRRTSARFLSDAGSPIRIGRKAGLPAMAGESESRTLDAGGPERTVAFFMDTTRTGVRASVGTNNRI